MSRWAVLSTTENCQYCALKERKNIDFQAWWEMRSSLCYYAARLSRNVGKKYRYSLRNNPVEHSSHLIRVGSLKSRT